MNGAFIIIRQMHTISGLSPGIIDDDDKRQKYHEKLKNIPVVVFTASGGSEFSPKIKALKVAGYITKPFDYDELLAKIKSIG